MATAKIFWTGQSQAVRLPREFRFDGKEVSIGRNGSSVILEPIEKSWDWLDRLEPLDEDAVAAATERSCTQERSGLDDQFK